MIHAALNHLTPILDLTVWSSFLALDAFHDVF